MKNRIPKKRNRFHRWIAIALTLTLLTGQGNLFVLAKENPPVNTESSDASKPDTTEDGGTNTGDIDSDNPDSGITDADGNNTDQTDNDNDDNDDDNDDDKQDDNVENENTAKEDICICETKCGADSINPECPVCAVDYSACISDAEAELLSKLPVDEIIPENDDALTKTKASARAIDDNIADWEKYDFTFDGINYRILNDNEVEVGGQCENASGDVEVPASFTYGGQNYRVVGVGSEAFLDCLELNSIKLPNSIKYLASGAFLGCNDLYSIDIPKGVTTIGLAAFAECRNLNKIDIPDTVTLIEGSAFSSCDSLTTITIPNSVTTMKTAIFQESGLSNIEIPNSIENIEDCMFYDCHNLSSVRIWDSITSMERNAFYNCSKLSTLEIVITTGKPVTPPHVTRETFAFIPGNRSIVFLAEDGSRLTGDAFEAAKNAYLNQKDSDDDSDKDLWWGWKIENPPDIYQITYHLDDYTPSPADCRYSVGGRTLPQPEKTDFIFDGWYESPDYSGSKINAIGPDETGDKEYYGQWIENKTHIYKVTIRVLKDNQEWTDHGRTFALRTDHGTEFITDLTQVANGTYNIYDMTGITPDSYWSKAVDTGLDVQVDGVDTEVDVTVQDDNAEAEIHYYTVTFYDGDNAYGSDTPQKPQIVLRNKYATEPDRPVKANQRFTGWKTQNGGSTDFAFDTPVNDTANAYASWTNIPVTGTFIITAMSQGNGSISPSGVVKVNEGGTQTFTIAANTGSHIKSVTVDGVDVTAPVIRANGIYTFSGVWTDHTIMAIFEADSSQPGDGSPDKDNPSSGGNSSGGSEDNDPGASDNNPDVTDNDPGASNNTPNAININSGDNSKLDMRSSATSENSNPEEEKTTVSSPLPGAGEPKTGDASHVEIYATVAMIAGLTYLLLYFMDEERGMSEREKEVFVAAFIRWAKKGGTFRKCCAIAAIFCLLFYYHSIGKRTHRNDFSRDYLEQVLY